ncbi:hypothetical protein DSO57_1007534 [Entomophthora muscae]|uniref:Uncharacterized protein n=2 Tax=Entomophthora muscae TaxID=34485 RepID=A0ACC2UT17_9FUNG|nr:hypothetical protein DSO57_1025048 [Entomophthora muscae]KAJ9089968.1 hypothetical protein DSO57_1007534 [Entomophthora muscae]
MSGIGDNNLTDACTEKQSASNALFLSKDAHNQLCALLLSSASRSQAAKFHEYSVGSHEFSLESYLSGYSGYLKIEQLLFYCRLSQ